MNEVNLFLIASRNKFRFDTAKGQLITEQLWDLPLQSTRDAVTLDSIAQDLNRKLKAVTEESFVKPKLAGPEDELSQKLEIVKVVIAAKLEEKAAFNKAAEKSQKRQRLAELIARKDDQELESLSKEDLLKQLTELE